MAYGNEIKVASIVENWLFEIEGTGSNTLRLSFADCTVSDNFYRGAILNKPSIRESINLSRSTSKTSNVSISIADFQHNDGLISEILFGGSIYFLNQTVTVKSMINSETPNVIGYFKVSNISRDSDKISIEMLTFNPFNNIDLPTNKTSKNKYVPIQYGNYTKNTNTTYASAQFIEDLDSTDYFPAPYHQTRAGEEQFTTSIHSISSDAELAFYDKNLDAFIPFSNTGGANSSSFADHYYNTTGITFTRGFKYKPIKATDYHTQWSNEDNILKNGTGDYPQFSRALALDVEGITVLKNDTDIDYDFPKPKGVLKDLTLKVVFQSSHLVQNLTTSEYSSKLFIDWTGVGDAFEEVEEINASTSGFVDTTYTKVYASVGTDGEELDISFPETIKIAVRYVAVNASLPYNGVTNTIIRIKEVSAKAKVQSEEDDIDFAYCAGDGLPATGWELVDGGSTGLAITRIHEAHRDMLYRFAGITADTSTIDGWTDLASSRSAWLIRYWLMDVKELKRILEQLQYEGGFIFRFKRGNTAEPQYIHIKNSYNSSDYTITKADISNPVVNLTNYKDLQTRSDINYQKYPTGNRYKVGVRASSSTTRSNYGITAKENISDISLDAYVAPTIDAYTSGVPVENANNNDDFFAYYHNIHGEPKIEISADLINYKFFNLDIGDIVDFSDMYPEKIFAKSFTNIAFMITSIQRKLGTLKFKAREIGTIS